MKSKKRPEQDPLRKPFDRKVMERARKIAERYQIKIRPEDGRWFGVGVEEPGTYGDGRTLQQCMKDVRDALAATVAYLIEAGQPVVTPVVNQERSRRRKVA